MEFLGKLGIDPKLLIAQIVNFGLLLWFLTRFLYKPVIKQIEKEEKELNQAQIQKKELEDQRSILLEENKNKIDAIKKQAQKTLEEANEIAKQIKRKAEITTKEESLAIIRQSKNKANSLKLKIQEDVSKELQTEIPGLIRTSFSNILSLPLQKKLQDVFWINFIEQIKVLSLPKLQERNLIKPLRNIATNIKKSKKREGVLEEKLEEVLAQEIGPVVLEYTYPITEKQEKELKEVILKKNKIKVEIEKKYEKTLINGFRFEIMGTIVESNLLNIINNATKKTKLSK